MAPPLDRGLGAHRALHRTARPVLAALRLVVASALFAGVVGPGVATWFSEAPAAFTSARQPGHGLTAQSAGGRSSGPPPLAAVRGGEGEGLWLPDKSVVKAVEELGGTVTRADVLAQGVAAQGLERELLQLARASGATMQVNNQGDLLFEFPEDLQRSLRRHSFALRLRGAWQSARPWLGWGGRVAFGASLIATVALVYCAVLIVVSTSSRQGEDSDGNRVTILSQNSFAWWFGPDLLYWLSPRPYGYYSYYDGGLLYSEFYEPPPKMSFLESVFSFVFGDGDPNKQLLSETRWQLIGECIAQNGGAVVAEQIIPYLDPIQGGGSEESEQRALARAMLPVLLRFDGRPEVSSEGDVIYVFPALQEPRAAGEAIVGGASTEELRQRLEAVGCPSRASGREGVIADYRRAAEEMRAQGAAPAEYLPERELKLSEADEGQVATCVALGAFALLGTLYLGMRLGSPHMQLLARVYPVIAFVSQAHPWLLAYTAGFLGIPLFRWFRLGRLNAAIRQRNDWRSQQAAKLRRAGSRLTSRLLGAKKWASTRVGFGDAVYNSAESTSAAESRSEADDLRSFDERLGRTG